jgi:hypothetical protein
MDVTVWSEVLKEGKFNSTSLEMVMLIADAKFTRLTIEKACGAFLSRLST